MAFCFGGWADGGGEGIGDGEGPPFGGCGVGFAAFCGGGVAGLSFAATAAAAAGRAAAALGVAFGVAAGGAGAIIFGGGDPTAPPPCFIFALSLAPIFGAVAAAASFSATSYCSIIVPHSESTSSSLPSSTFRQTFSASLTISSFLTADNIFLSSAISFLGSRNLPALYALNSSSEVGSVAP